MEEDEAGSHDGTSQRPNPLKRAHSVFSVNTSESPPASENETSLFNDFFLDSPVTSGVATPTGYAAPLRRHFPGDGFDYRRPVMADAGSENVVIDLTNEDDAPAEQRQQPVQVVRAPRSRPRTTEPQRRNPVPAEVIDLEGGDTVAATGESTANPRFASPEVEFVRANPISGELQGDTQNPRRAPPAQAGREAHGASEAISVSTFGPYYNTTNLLSRAYAGITELGEFLSVPRIMPNHYARSINLFNSSSLPEDQAQENFHIQLRPAFLQRATPLPRENSSGVEEIRVDMTAQAFPYGTARRAASPTPTYEEPPAAREGFTRSAEEGDVVVCPNCDDELGAGDTPEKRQVWVIRSCGHVYCGTCAKYRMKSSRSGKGKQKAVDVTSKPFSVCAVEDCTSKVSGAKHMFQIFI